MSVVFFFLFKQKTAYELRISDWSSDVCSSDLSLPAYRPMEWPLLLHGSGRCSRLHAACQSQAAGRGFRRRRDGHGTSGNDPRLELCEGQSDRDARPDRKSVVSGKRVSVRVDVGGRRIIKTKKTTYV